MAIRCTISEIYDETAAETIRIQCSGSVSAASAPELLHGQISIVNLVGGASLKLISEDCKIISGRKHQETDYE